MIRLPTHFPQSDPVRDGRYELPAIHLHKALKEYERASKNNENFGYADFVVRKFLDDLPEALSCWPKRLEELLDIRLWILQKLKDGLVFGGRFVKPPIGLEISETSAENLTIRWYVDTRIFTNEQRSDLEKYIRVMQYSKSASARPPNELVFIHQSCVIDRLIKSGQRELATHSVNFIKTLYETIFDVLMNTFDVQKDFDVELIFDGDELKEWKFFDVAERKKEEAKKWILGFEQEYGLSPETFLEELANHTGHDAHAKASKVFKKAGLKLTPSTVRFISERLREFFPEL